MSSAITRSGQSTQSATLARKLRQLILEGRFSPDEPLPSHRDLAATHGVGVQVVRSALAILQQQGLVDKHARRGFRGVFIRPEAGRDTARRGRDGKNAGSRKKAGSRLRCITFLERATGTTPGFVRTGYLHGFSEALEALDIKMRFVACPPDLSRWEKILSRHVPMAQQGCVLINVTNPALMQWLGDHGIPFVVQSNKAYDAGDCPPHHGLFINKMRGGFELASHLVTLGHQRIGFVGDAPSNYHEHHDVYSGCVAGMAYAGLQMRSDDVLHVGMSDLLLTASPLRQYLQRDGLPTAIIAQNDSLALLVMRIAQDMGMHLPADLSIAGYDNLPQSEQACPSLTTFLSPRVMLGKAAVATLLELAANPKLPPAMHMIEGHLLARQSTAPPGRQSRAGAGDSR